MKCIENKILNNQLHNIFEEAGSWIVAEDGDAYLCGYFSGIGEDGINVSVYGASFTDAVSEFIDGNCHECDGNIIASKYDEAQLSLFINVIDEQLNRLKAIKVED